MFRVPERDRLPLALPTGRQGPGYVSQRCAVEVAGSVGLRMTAFPGEKLENVQ